MDLVKPEKEIQSSLFSADNNIVLAAIERIKKEGNKNYLPILFDFLITQPEQSIEKEILKLLSTIKDPASVPIFVEAMQNPKYLSIQKNILTCCWQNGLNFSKYIELFIDFVISSEWEVAFEAFTLIENFDSSADEETLNAALTKINANINSVDNQKKYFLEEIKKML